MEVPLHFIEDILGGASQENGAGSWRLALDEVREVLVTNLPDIEQTALSSNIGLLNLLGPVNNLSTGDSGDSDIIGFPDSSDA